MAETFTTTLQTIDAGQIWVPLEDLRKMAAMPGEATMAVVRQGFQPSAVISALKARARRDAIVDEDEAGG